MIGKIFAYVFMAFMISFIILIVGLVTGALMHVLVPESVSGRLYHYIDRYPLPAVAQIGLTLLTPAVICFGRY